MPFHLLPNLLFCIMEQADMCIRIEKREVKSLNDYF